jgi:hypothetical protein
MQSNGKRSSVWAATYLIFGNCKWTYPDCYNWVAHDYTTSKKCVSENAEASVRFLGISDKILTVKSKKSENE